MRKTKGFTLVELLIVIIIIGILAGMMMISIGAATDKAEATKIVSNLRNIKAAAIMFYADENKWDFTSELDLHGTDAKAVAIAKYLDKKPDDGYVLAKADEKISVGYTKVLPGVASKLSLMAANAGLRNAAITSADVTSADQVISTAVYMVVN